MKIIIKGIFVFIVAVGMFFLVAGCEDSGWVGGSDADLGVTTSENVSGVYSDPAGGEIVFRYLSLTNSGSTYAIYTFVVNQVGGTVEFTDNYGDKYSGTIVEIAQIPEATDTNNTVLVGVGINSFQFDVRGTSGGLGVQIIGTIYAGAMNGTWIEDDGLIGAVEAQEI
ncbi:hypothetical protein ACFLS1_11130 [Verrucomicrobiota bacterium]